MITICTDNPEAQPQSAFGVGNVTMAPPVTGVLQRYHAGNTIGMFRRKLICLYLMHGLNDLVNKAGGCINNDEAKKKY